ncbi:MAG TPA: protein phosphatase 2C domain-containing protein [Pseudomonadales bacterium]
MSSAGGRIELVGRTDRGRLRERNEDNLAFDETIGVAVVADGMGGLDHGHLASRTAAETVLAHLRAAGPGRSAADLEAALGAANDRVREAARAAAAVMGTTAVVLDVAADACRIAHVGDSRAYRLHRGELTLLTRDHSMVQDLVERGLLRPEAARHSPSRNVITRAIGLDVAFEPEIRAIELEAGDLLLLCSDGLWDMLEDAEIAERLRRSGANRRGLERCADALVNAANAAGGFDNITVVLARVRAAG